MIIFLAGAVIVLVLAMSLSFDRSRREVIVVIPEHRDYPDFGCGTLLLVLGAILLLSLILMA